jgi:hypothetical protein
MKPAAKPPRSSAAAILCLVGCAAGVLVLLAGIGWSLFGSGRAVYTEEQAQEHRAAGVALHAATSGHVGEGEPTGPPVPRAEREASVAAARERFEKAEAELKSARFAQNALGKWLITAGLAAAVAFGVGYVASRRNSE